MVMVAASVLLLALVCAWRCCDCCWCRSVATSVCIRLVSVRSSPWYELGYSEDLVKRPLSSLTCWVSIAHAIAWWRMMVICVRNCSCNSSHVLPISLSQVSFI